MKLHWFGRLTVAAALGAAGCSLLVDAKPSDDPDCLEHIDCETGVCDRGLGSCVSEDEIIYLDGSEGADAAGCGSRAQPCRQPVAALERVSETRRTLLLRNGDFDPFAVDGNQLPRDRILVVGSSDARVVGGLVTVEVVGGGSLALEDLTIAEATSVDLGAVQCSDSVLRMRHVVVEDSVHLAMLVTDCSQLSIESSTFRRNRGGGIYLARTHFEIVNNVIVHNGLPAAQYAGVHIVDNQDIAPGRFEFNTLAQNRGINAWGVHCDAPDQTMSNSIVVSTLDDGDGVSGPCAWAYSNIQRDNGAVQAGPGNRNDPASFVDPDENFHLGADSSCIDNADPETELVDALAVDFDGDPRPAGDAPDIGADESN